MQIDAAERQAREMVRVVDIHPDAGPRFSVRVRIYGEEYACTPRTQQEAEELYGYIVSGLASRFYWATKMLQG